MNGFASVDKHVGNAVHGSELNVINFVGFLFDIQFLDVQTRPAEIVRPAVLSVHIVPSMRELDFFARGFCGVLNIPHSLIEHPVVIDKQSFHKFLLYFYR